MKLMAGINDIFTSVITAKKFKAFVPLYDNAGNSTVFPHLLSTFKTEGGVQLYVDGSQNRGEFFSLLSSELIDGSTVCVDLRSRTPMC